MNAPEKNAANVEDAIRPLRNVFDWISAAACLLFASVCADTGVNAIITRQTWSLAMVRGLFGWYTSDIPLTGYAAVIMGIAWLSAALALFCGPVLIKWYPASVRLLNVRDVAMVAGAVLLLLAVVTSIYQVF